MSVKRIFLDRCSYVGTTEAEAPWYHHRNVAAFPQSPEAALTALGCTPQALAQTLMVQFVGDGQTSFRTHKDLKVSVPRLRAAFQWLSTNSWPFMDATRDHPA